MKKEIDETYKDEMDKMKQILQQNMILIWEFDSKNHKIINTEEQGKPGISTLGYMEKEVLDVPESIIRNKIIYADDEETYRKMYERIYAGEKLVSDAIRMWNVLELDYVWYQIVFSVQGEIGTEQCKVICSCQDISSFKNIEQRFQEEIMYHKEIASSVIAVSRVNISQNIVEEVNVNNTSLEKDKIRNCVDLRERLSLFMDMIQLSDEENQKFMPEKLLEQYQKGVHKFTHDFTARLLPEEQMARIRTEVRMLERPDREDIVAFFYHQNVTEEFCKNCFIEECIEKKTEFAGLLFKDTGYFYLYASQNNGKKVHTDYMQFMEVYMKMYALEDELEEVEKQTAVETIISKLSHDEKYILQLKLKDVQGGIRRKEFTYSYGNRNAGVIIVFCHDVEEQMQLREKQNLALAEAKKAVDEAERVKRDFLSRMSHEIRTPMNVIMGITSLVEKDLDNREAIKDYLAKIDVSSRHLLNLITDVWDMSRIESGEFVLNADIVHYEEMEKQVEDMIMPLFKTKRVQMVKTMMPSHMPILLDKVRLTQVFFNLLSNAVNFTAEGGKIYVDYRHHLVGKRQVCDFEIEHAGVGMNEEYQKNMFEPFKVQNEDDANSNTLQGADGLGMSLAKAVIEKMGGTLTVNSKVGQGTIFHIHLIVPIAEEKEEKVEIVEQYNEQFLKGKRILLVEDHPLNQTIVVRLLKNMGANVVTANDGQQSVDIFDDSINGYFDAILMDIRMPVMDGLTASKVIRSMKREDAKKVPIIAMTANAYAADKEKSYEAGMIAHLSKPIEPKLLYQTLQNALNKASEQQESGEDEE